MGKACELWLRQGASGRLPLLLPILGFSYDAVDLPEVGPVPGGDQMANRRNGLLLVFLQASGVSACNYLSEKEILPFQFQIPRILLPQARHFPLSIVICLMLYPCLSTSNAPHFGQLVFSYFEY